MKCIKNNKHGEVRRVPDVVAEKVIKVDSDWVFCPKSEWKDGNPIPRRRTNQLEINDEQIAEVMN